MLFIQNRQRTNADLPDGPKLIAEVGLAAVGRIEAREVRRPVRSWPAMSIDARSANERNVRRHPGDRISRDSSDRRSSAAARTLANYLAQVVGQTGIEAEFRRIVHRLMTIDVRRQSLRRKHYRRRQRRRTKGAALQPLVRQLEKMVHRFGGRPSRSRHGTAEITATCAMTKAAEFGRGFDEARRRPAPQPSDLIRIVEAPPRRRYDFDPAVCPRPSPEGR